MLTSGGRLFQAEETPVDLVTRERWVRGRSREDQRRNRGLTVWRLLDHCEDVSFCSEINGEWLQGIELDKWHDLTYIAQRSLHVENRRWQSRNCTGGFCRNPGQWRECGVRGEETTHGQILHLRCQGSKSRISSWIRWEVSENGGQRERANGFWLEQLVTWISHWLRWGQLWAG